MQDNYLIVLTTFPDENSAITVARQLVRLKLAGCVNILPKITSIYEWQNETQTGTEVLLLIKTTRLQYETLETTIREGHPYELPEIVATPITHGLKDYLKWIETQTHSTP